LINDFSAKRNSNNRKGSNSYTRGTLQSKDSMTNMSYANAAAGEMNTITL
jgi:hypothetical protein